jgi:hypothetical protein
VCPAAVYLLLAVVNYASYSRSTRHTYNSGAAPTLAELKGQRVVLAGMKDEALNGHVGTVDAGVASECRVTMVSEP